MMDTVVQDALRLAIAIPITYGASANYPGRWGKVMPCLLPCVSHCCLRGGEYLTV